MVLKGTSNKYRRKPMTITKEVIFVAREDNIEELKALLKTMIKPSQASQGCLLYEIYQMDDKSNTFVVIESWRDEAALDRHKNSAHYNHYKSHYEPFTAEKYSHSLCGLG